MLAVVLALLLVALGVLSLDRAYRPATAASPVTPSASSPATTQPPEVEQAPPSELLAAGTAASPVTPEGQGALRLTVPDLGIDRDAAPLGTSPDGTLEVPATAQGVGWYSGGPSPGDDGPAVLAGHVDLDGRPGVFSRLSTMQAGQELSVLRPDGRQVRFVVTRVEQHAKGDFPTDAVYGPTDAPELRLITCGGSFDRRRGSYRDNVVVFAVLA